VHILEYVLASWDPRSLPVNTSNGANSHDLKYRIGYISRDSKSVAYLECTLAKQATVMRSSELIGGQCVDVFLS
jgi:hypothetical protein